MFKSFDILLQHVKQMENKTVVIAAAQTPTAIEAGFMAIDGGLSNITMTGDRAYIENHINTEYSGRMADVRIVDTGTDLRAACVKAVELIKNGEGDLILKGKCETATLLKVALDKVNGLRTGEIISDVLAYETPDRLVLLSDGGINLYPELKDMLSIIRNAVNVAHAMQCPEPKVALLSAVEKVNPKMQCTMDAALISKMNHRRQITGCVIDGPLAFDNAISVEAARMKGINSPVAGHADVLIVPNIESGNIFGKSLTYYCKWQVAHVVMGAAAPILIASRADDAKTKMLSMAMGILCA
ncbi:MAG: bifunctional enoyl-CoA hydratase/phosphate acetyltransferase [Candidatus Cloacimonetes bacterium]|nr:bifunctional enoyl-CoA hydratase/phosphate acetyltransferase [Candidatus Cloacimonadota bacterium]